MLASKIADTNNVSSGPFAGSITAALFLKKFVSAAKAWGAFRHLRLGFVDESRASQGAEIQTARLCDACMGSKRYE